MIAAGERAADNSIFVETIVDDGQRANAINEPQIGDHVFAEFDAGQTWISIFALNQWEQRYGRVEKLKNV